MAIIKFIIAEESYIIRKGLINIISSYRNTEIVKEIDDESKLIKSVNKLSPDFLIVNIRMFDNLIKDIKKQFSGNISTKFIAFNDNYKKKDEFPYFFEILKINDSRSGINEKIKKMISVVSENKIESDSDLTDREIDVIKQVSLGKTNKEIADSLSISIHTVISHRKNIVTKLGIKTVSGLTVYAILNKIISIEEVL